MRTMMMTLLLLAGMTTVSAQESISNSTAAPVVRSTEKIALPTKGEQYPDMALELGLTAEQMQQASEVNLRFAKATAQLEKAGMADDAGMKRLDVLRKNRDGGLQRILTPEQFTSMLAIREQRQDRDAVPSPHPVK